MAKTSAPESVKPLLYRPMPRWHWWAAMGGAVALHLTAIVLAQKREAPPIDLSEIPAATVEATLQPEEQPTPPPEEIVAPTPPPEPEVQPEFHEETTPPPKQVKPPKLAPIKAPTVGHAGPMSISSAKALAVYSPRPPYPYEARSRHMTGSGVCVVTVDGSGSVSSAVMAQSIGNQILDNAAVETFKRWRFRPGTVSKVKIPITFTMSGASY